MSPNGNGTIISVPFVSNIEIVFQSFESGQTFLPSPIRQIPLVVVAWPSSEGDARVDRGRSTDDASTGKYKTHTMRRRGRLGITPIVPEHRVARSVTQVER